MSSRSKKLIDDATPDTSVVSAWFNIANLDDPTVHIFGLGAGDGVTVEVSNEDDLHGTTGSATDNGVAVGGGEQTSDGLVEVPEGAKVVRARVSSDGANENTVSALLHGRVRET